MDCWEYKACSDNVRLACPAYPDKGLECWKVTGTMCDNGKMAMATVMEKISFCRKCDFYVNHAAKY
jgi:hypothetical protein